MKKIILFMFMIITSVNLFSNDIPSELFYYSKKAYLFHEKVNEDFEHNNNIVELKDEYYLGMFDDELFGYFTYKIKISKNNERTIIVIFNDGDTYYYTWFKAETTSGLLLTFCNIRIFNNKDVLLCEIELYLEDGNVIYERYFDPTTFTYYNKYK